MFVVSFTIIFCEMIENAKLPDPDGEVSFARGFRGGRIPEEVIIDMTVDVLKPEEALKLLFTCCETILELPAEHVCKIGNFFGDLL